MNNLRDKEINYLGAFLHDIGKLIWRTQDIKAGEDHEKLGEKFIREYLGKVNCLKNDIDEIIKAANRQRGKIWKADVIAAEEREDSEDKAPRRYLEAISNRVDIGIPNIKSKSKNYWYYLPKALSLSKDDNFPVDSKNSLTNYSHNESEYQNFHKILLNSLVNDVDKLREETDFKAFSRTFIKLLEKYTSRVLSAGYLSHPDISLFDHSRITAALSVCFEVGNENKECLLIKGDLSGIQSYIYREIREMTDIAKRLRGRSFTIQLLSEIISNYIIENLDLFDANLIYNGGGHFLILAPNNSSNLDILSKLASKVNLALLTKYDGKISLVLEYEECSGKEFINNFRDVYLKLDEKLTNKKKLKFRDNLNFLFTIETNAKNYRTKVEQVINLEKNIGETLPKLKYLVLSNDLISFNKSNQIVQLNFSEFETFVYLCQDSKSVEALVSSANKKNNLRIFSINDTDFLEPFVRNIFLNVSKEFRFLGNTVPTKNDKIISFEDLAEKHSKNYPLLGIMRMDVDNLGAIFSFGLLEENKKEKKYTPSRIAYLSRELNWFFTGYINEVAKKFDIYIAYSGGDDVFVVGNWYSILKFAQKLRDDFEAFVCTNNNLTASAGILFTKPNFPISQSALLAGEQESLAKRTMPRLEKDKVGVLDIQLTWKEFSEFIDYADELSNFIETESGKKEIPRSFLYYIYSITNNIFDNQGKLNLRMLNKATANLHYMFARKKITSSVIESQNKQKKINKLLYDLAVRLLLSREKEKEFKKIKFPLTIALYKTRR
ncbi:MAG: type III-A CRISPR-associated protein Cas10/Csm1 [Candidatus Kapaibacteriales bacterium]